MNTVTIQTDKLQIRSGFASETGKRETNEDYLAIFDTNTQPHIIHIGDTRIYRLRQRRLQRLTSDHVHHHPDMRHVLHRAIGFDESAHLDCEKHSLMLHDRFLLCSDGVHGVLSDRRIQSILDEGSSPEDTAKRIVESALQAGSQDNVSGLAVDVVALPPPDQSDLATAIADLPVQPLPKSGEEIDGFKLQEMIFDARNSRLFRAQDKIEEREVVLKFPHPRICDEEAHHRAFAREAWIAARTHSP